MTKQAAIEAMKSGEKVTHRFFEYNEWITMKNEFIVSEDGCVYKSKEFWSVRKSDYWNTDWSIWGELQ